MRNAYIYNIYNHAQKTAGVPKSTCLYGKKRGFARLLFCVWVFHGVCTQNNDVVARDFAFATGWVQNK